MIAIKMNVSFVLLIWEETAAIYETICINFLPPQSFTVSVGYQKVASAYVLFSAVRFQSNFSEYFCHEKHFMIKKKSEVIIAV